ncbi:hypothetical protein PM10SUCC1_14530 [Propionigenium maris DSM 9537]|uniref:FtsX extracellular domain-containing protein n=1 Tax=Propionigenium maris DSM 9537 TaxID=1123000 RepID=A0A9W6LML4_9FUSO|nr:permease-like cell division protein FtsX [Propionigenium maris]GLI55939.1 hypothetical protein PM10SUCC1_14530 [Propionigenium maris DSM 9537]
MLKKVKVFFGELNDIIAKGIKGYRMNLFTLIAAFIVLNTASAVLVNIHKNNENLRDNYKLSIYFKGDPSEERLNEFEGRLLEMPEVRSLKYESREVALRDLENQLGIRVPRGNNPLSNNFLVTFDGEKSLESLQQQLDKEDLIKEVYLDKEQLQSLNNRIEKNRGIFLSFLAGGFLPLIFIIFSLFHSNILYNNRDINSKIFIGESHKAALKPYYMISDCIFVSASAIGTLIFLNIYELFRKSFIGIEKGGVLASTEEVLVVAVVVTAVTTVIFPLLSRSLYRVSGE